MSRVTLFQSDGNCAVITHADNSQDDHSREVVTLQNVYELASEIGEHFKKIIAEYGEEFNDHLIPCVVKVLELLENTVIQREDEIVNIEKLHKQIHELQLEKEEREQHHMKFVSEIEDYDESWRKEHVELSHIVKHLKNENDRLVKSLHDSRTNSLSDLKEEDSDNEISKCSTIKFNKLKRRLSILSKEVDFKRSEVESLRCQNNSLLDENEILKNSLENSNLNPEDKKNDQNSSETSSANIKKRSQHNKHYKQRIKSLEAEVELYKSLLKITTKEIKPNLSLYSRSSESSPSSSAIENHDISPSASLTSHQIVNNDNCATLEQEIINDTDRPVQGPLPREPPEKNWPRQSKIWRFFPRLKNALIGTSFI